MLRGIIFDADGTLLDSTSMWMQAGTRYLQTRGIQADPTLGEAMFAMSLNDSAAYMKRLYAMQESCEEIIAGINATIHGFYQDEVCLKPGALALLESLHEQGIPMTLATATDRHLIEDGLRHCGILHYFQAIFTCGEVGHGKERPDIYLAACAAMNTPVGETWVFEDALHGVETAKTAGFRVVAVYDPMSRSHSDALRSLADLYLTDLCDTTTFFQYCAK